LPSFDIFSDSSAISFSFVMCWDYRPWQRRGPRYKGLPLESADTRPSLRFVGGHVQVASRTFSAARTLTEAIAFFQDSP
jgi:hypothetical protein